MGKVRTRMLGLEDLEKQQIEEQKARSAEKRAEKTAESSEPADAPVAAKKKVEIKGRNPRKGGNTVRGKKYLAAAKQVQKDKTYKVAEAVAAVKKIAYAKFPESVELHLTVDKTGLKGEVELPHATGKTVRVRVLDEKTLDEIEQGKIDFDILVTHPSFMPKLAKHARVLGPKGLMPNPKNGTVSPNPEEVAKKFEKGSLQWKSEPKASVVHQMIAKLASPEEEIAANAIAFMQAVGKLHIKAAYLKSTMSPAFTLDLSEIQ
jgi:large subunit ribosomal protein L1